MGKKQYAVVPMGMKTAQAQMCITMEEAAEGIPELAVFVDDSFGGVPAGQWEAALELEAALAGTLACLVVADGGVR